MGGAEVGWSVQWNRIKRLSEVLGRDQNCIGKKTSYVRPVAGGGAGGA